MKKHAKSAPPKRRSPVPPPGRIIGDTSYRRRNDRRKLREAVTDFQKENRSPIKLVVFDLDGTLWSVEGGCSSLMSPPFEKIDGHTISDSAGNTLKLVTGVRKLFNWLRSRDILISIASRSDKKIVFDILKLLQLSDFAASPQVAWERKLRLIQTISDEVRCKYDIKLRRDQVLLVDDSESNIHDAKSAGIRTALIGRDVPSVRELPAFISSLR